MCKNQKIFFFKYIYLLFIALLLQITPSCVHYSKKISWVNSVYNKSLAVKPKVKNKNISTSNLPQKEEHTYYNTSFQNFLDITTQSELTAANNLNILVGQQSLYKKIDLITGAKSTIFIATFDMFCDISTKKIVRELEKAITRGVDVYFLYDGSLMASSGRKCRKKMKKIGVKVLRSKNTFSYSQKNQRIHEKFFIVDLTQAIIGGSNYGEWYFGKDDFGRHYRDTDLFVSGPLVSDIASRFFTLWNYFADKNNKLNRYFKIVEKIKEKERKQKIRGSKNYSSWLAPNQRKGLCRLIKQEPYLNNFALFDAYIYLAENATKQIDWNSIYLDTLDSFRHQRLGRALKKLASQKNATVNIFINGAGLVHILPPPIGTIVSKMWLSKAYDSTVGSDISLHLYSTWFHSKMVVFDNIAVSIGGFNFNELASVFTESNAICMDKALAKQAQNLVLSDIRNSLSIASPKISE